VSVDPRAVRGFAAAEAYERGRPSYPAAAVAAVARELGLGPGSAVLDLAAGTGKLTRQLVGLVGRVTAVEPAGGMLAVLRERLPEVDAREGAAEAIPLADGVVDAVFVGEAFHWFQTADAAREIVRVLVAGGGLALLWNRARWSDDDLPWHSAFSALSRPYREAAGEFPAERWQDALEASGLFEPLRSTEAEHVQVTDPEGFVAQVASWSWIVNLPDGERTRFLAQVRELIGEQGELQLRYRTEIHWTRRRGERGGA
jgi:SAM-dependent methyltransferase